ncbi:MAG: hypothetical protein JW909_12700 [Planctomycetes bacterium]|nr:hypothetical protein [Planctomycetota bacterium]
MKVFLAGIIQGSDRGRGIHPQDYRTHIKRMIEEHVPGAEVYDPVAEYPGSVDYEDEYAREVFFGLMRGAAEADMLIAFLPEASLGTAIELWEARKAGVYTVAVTPMLHNWVVKFLPDRVVGDLGELEELLRSGEIGKGPG